MFIEASAFCAIFLDEIDGADFERRVAATERCWTSPVAVWETVRALSRERNRDVAAASTVVTDYLVATGVRMVAIGEREQALALEAFDRFGKGRHPAALNMGDCFAYACARALSVPLLYKGDDFALTDIDAA